MTWAPAVLTRLYTSPLLPALATGNLLTLAQLVTGPAPAAATTTAPTAPTTTAVSAGSAPAADDPSAQVPPLLRVADLQDTHGIGTGSYYHLPLSGGGLTNPEQTVWKMYADGAWTSYQLLVTMAIWFLDWAASGDWMTALSGPVVQVSDAVYDTMTGTGLGIAFGTIAALVALVALVRGRPVACVFHVLMAATVFVMAFGALSRPGDLIAGPDGVLAQTQQAGQQLAAALVGADTSDTGGTGAEVNGAVSGVLVDTWIRIPHQMVSYGTVLDGGPCEGAYDQAMRENSPDPVTACNPGAKAWVEHPGVVVAATAIMLIPTGLIIMAVSAVLGGAILVAALTCLYLAIKLAVTVFVGILPGGGRLALADTISELFVSLGVLVFSLVFLTITMRILALVLAGMGPDTIGQGFLICDILIVALTVVFIRQRKKLLAAVDRMAKWLATTPGSIPPAGPIRPHRDSAAGLVAAGVGLAMTAGRLAWAKTTSAGAPTSPLHAPPHPATPAPPTPGFTGWSLTPTPGPGSSGSGSGGQGPRPGPGAPRTGTPPARAYITRVALTGAELALAAGTGGTSSAVVRGTIVAAKVLPAIAQHRQLARRRLELPAAPGPAPDPGPGRGPLALPPGPSSTTPTSRTTPAPGPGTPAATPARAGLNDRLSAALTTPPPTTPGPEPS